MNIHKLNAHSSHAPSRRQKEKDGRRQAILSAAEEAFSVLGFHEASLVEIARRADLAVGTIYLYFSDKSDLYGQVILAKMEQVVRLFEEALGAGETAAAGLRAAIHAQFGFHDANRSFFEIFLHQHQLQNSPLHPRHWENLEECKRRIRERIEECIRSGQARGEIKPGDPRLYAVAFLGMTLQIIRQAIRERSEEPLTRAADFAADCFLGGATTR